MEVRSARASIVTNKKGASMAKLKRPTLIAIIVIRGLARFVRRQHRRYRPERHYMRGPGPATKARLFQQKS